MASVARSLSSGHRVNEFRLISGSEGLGLANRRLGEGQAGIMLKPRGEPFKVKGYTQGSGCGRWGGKGQDF